MSGKAELPEQDYKDVIALAKEAIKSRGIIYSLEQKLLKKTSRYRDLENKSTKDREERKTRQNLYVNKKHGGYER